MNLAPFFKMMSMFLQFSKDALLIRWMSLVASMTPSEMYRLDMVFPSATFFKSSLLGEFVISILPFTLRVLSTNVEL